MSDSLTVGSTILALVEGDITALAADAVVTAANRELRGGGGVDGAVHRAAGRELLSACRVVGGCPTGSAVITPAFKLTTAKFIIHAVGPVWRGGNRGEDELLAGAYRHALELAAENNCRTILFPSISTGVYGFPVARAAPVALRAACAFARQHPAALDRITWALFDRQTLSVYQQALAHLATGGTP